MCQKSSMCIAIAGIYAHVRLAGDDVLVSDHACSLGGSASHHADADMPCLSQKPGPGPVSGGRLSSRQSGVAEQSAFFLRRNCAPALSGRLGVIDTCQVRFLSQSVHMK